MKATKILALSLVTVMMFAMFAGCAPKENTDKPSTGDPVDGVKGRTDIVLAESSDVTSPDPHDQNDSTSARVIYMMFNNLVKLGADNTVVPDLAESWTVSEDSLEYTFVLRQGVKFHNGEELKASDVKFSIERQKASAKAKTGVDAVTEVVVNSDYSVTIKTATPYAPMLLNLSRPISAIVSEKAVTEAGDKFKDAPVGTGPMKFKSWKPNDSFVVERFDDYFEGKPVATSITVRVIPEATSKTIALETGEVDFVGVVASIDNGRVIDNPELKIVEQAQGSVNYIGMNQLSAPFDNIKVRQALSYAVNREAMIDVILEGYGTVSNTVFPSMMPGYDGDLALYSYDPEKAKTLLSEAGFPDGFKTEIATSGDERNRVAQLLQADFAPIGVELDIQLLEWGAYLDYVSGNDHKMFVLGWSNSYNPDDNMTPLFHSTSSSVTNRSHFKNAEIDTLIEAARSELDWAKREPMYKELQKKVMEQAVWIPIYQKQIVVGMNKNLEGVELMPIEAYRFHNAYVAE